MKDNIVTKGFILRRLETKNFGSFVLPRCFTKNKCDSLFLQIGTLLQAGKNLFRASESHFVLIGTIVLFLLSCSLLTAQSIVTDTITVQPKWNMISVPLVAPDGRTTTLFPYATTNAFTYNNGYTAVEELTPGVGYWLKFDSAETITITGTRTTEPCISLEQGWNLVGMFSRNIPTSTLYTDQRDNFASDFYGYTNTGYYKTDTLKTGVAYWVKAKSGGTMKTAIEPENWELIIQDVELSSVAIHPNNTNIIYVGIPSIYSFGTHGKVLKSLDGGNTWDTLFRADVHQVDIDPVDPEIVYLSCGVGNSDTPGIFKTTDGGKAWFHADSGIHMDWETWPFMSVINPKDNNVLYAFTYGFWGGFPYKSTDGGVSWLPLVNSDTLGCPDDSLCYLGASHINMNPQNPSTLYGYCQMGISWYFKSYDEGMTWEIARDVPVNSGYFTTREVDPRDTNIIYVRMDSGLYKSEDGGQVWFHVDSNLPPSDWNDKIVITNVNNTLLFQSNNNLYQTNDAGYTWTKLGVDEIWDTTLDNYGFIYLKKEFGSCCQYGIYRQKLICPTSIKTITH